MAKVKVDGYELALAVEQIKPLKCSIMSYVNGEFKGEWLSEKFEESKRFMRPVQVAAFKPADKVHMCKGLSKMLIKELYGDINKSFTSSRWDWSSFDSLRCHLIGNNTSMDLVEPASQ
jgi:hypothetical protein